MIQSVKPSCNRRSAQTLVEFAMLVILIFGVFFLIQRSVLKGIGKLWKVTAQEIAAPCPRCTPPEAFK